jgi:hypothetical protein
MSDQATESTPEQRRALLRVVRGEPDDIELAALTVVLTAAVRAGCAEHPARGQRHGLGVWVDRRAQLRRPLYPGPGAWQASVLPR